MPRILATALFVVALLVPDLALPAQAARFRDVDSGHVLSRLGKAYPDLDISGTCTEAGNFVIFRPVPDERGKRIPPSGREHILISPHAECPPASPDQQTDVPLCTMFMQPYPWGEGGRHPDRDFDPGRARNEAFFKKLYGANEREVRQNLVPVDFFGTKVMFNSRHGASAALERVIVKLDSMMREEPELKAYILPTAGTFAWRTIKDSPRLSFHSFGICIDLNVDKGIYWNWDPKPTATQREEAQKNYPQSIVDAFESEGFIWGGKWFHFDYMHFEYRPELREYGIP